MKRLLSFISCLPLLASCANPITTSQKEVMAYGNTFHIASGTLHGGRFVLVEKTQKGWEGELKGGAEKFNARRNLLHNIAGREIQSICGEVFFAMHKGPIYNMLDSDETMGGVAPALGVTVAIAAYIVADAATKDENIPVSGYIEFGCASEEK